MCSLYLSPASQRESQFEDSRHQHPTKWFYGAVTTPLWFLSRTVWIPSVVSDAFCMEDVHLCNNLSLPSIPPSGHPQTQAMGVTIDNNNLPSVKLGRSVA